MRKPARTKKNSTALVPDTSNSLCLKKYLQMVNTNHGGKYEPPELDG
jgi:hypothetical protein